jgi:hypothetical protein
MKPAACEIFYKEMPITLCFSRRVCQRKSVAILPKISKAFPTAFEIDFFRQTFYSYLGAARHFQEHL